MEQMLTQTSILSRNGWSKKVLDSLLGEPDLRKKVFGRTNLSALYLERRVLEAEQSESFASMQASLEKRKIAAAKATATKTESLLAQIAAMQVSVKILQRRNLVSQAITSYNERQSDMGSYAHKKSDAAFLDRICVNYIRHELTGYDHALQDVAGRTGITQAVHEIRRKIYAAIAAAYPEYAAECMRQQTYRLEN
jgi:hypothetical protein